MVKPDPTVVRRFLVAGFAIPCAAEFVLYIGDVKLMGDFWSYALVAVWPSFGYLMIADALGGDTAAQVIAFAVATGLNVAVYGLVGCVASIGYRAARRYCAGRTLVPTRARRAPGDEPAGRRPGRIFYWD